MITYYHQSLISKRINSTFNNSNPINCERISLSFQSLINGRNSPQGKPVSGSLVLSDDAELFMAS